jgi:hypothetical protein
MYLATLSLALLEGGFCFISSSEAVTGFLFTNSKTGGGQLQIACVLSQ